MSKKKEDKCKEFGNISDAFGLGAGADVARYIGEDSHSDYERLIKYQKRSVPRNDYDSEVALLQYI